MNKDILMEKIQYLSSMPHHSLVEHCIYLENENDNYKAQKYITDFISENGIICEKNKKIEELQQAKDKLQNDYQEAKDRIDEFKFTIKTQQQMIDELINKIDKAIEYIKETGLYCDYGDLCSNHTKELLEILGDKENEEIKNKTN